MAAGGLRSWIEIKCQSSVQPFSQSYHLSNKHTQIGANGYNRKFVRRLQGGQPTGAGKAVPFDGVKDAGRLLTLRTQHV